MVIFHLAAVLPLCFLRRRVSYVYHYKGLLIRVVRISGGRYFHYYQPLDASFNLSRGGLWFVSSLPFPGQFFLITRLGQLAGRKRWSTGVHPIIEQQYQRRMQPITLTHLL